MNTYDRNINELCRDRLRPAFKESCENDGLKQSLNEEAKSGVLEIYVAVSNVDIVDLPLLIKNQTKVPVGEFDEESTTFKHVRVVKTKASSHFVISDSAGYLTTLVKNLRLKSRIYSTANDILSLKTH